MHQQDGQNVQYQQEHTCFFPLTPRCGVAKVIKLTGSNPAIISRLEEHGVFEFELVEKGKYLDSSLLK